MNGPKFTWIMKHQIKQKVEKIQSVCAFAKQRANFSKMNHRDYLKTSVKPMLVERINQINLLHNQNETKRKHEVNGIPFNMVSMIDDVINEGTDQELEYLLICISMTYNDIPYETKDLSIEDFINKYKECLETSFPCPRVGDLTLSQSSQMWSIWLATKSQPVLYKHPRLYQICAFRRPQSWLPRSRLRPPMMSKTETCWSLLQL